MNRAERVGCLALASLFLLISLALHRRLLSSEPRSSYINHVYSVENADAVILSTASRLSGITTATLFSGTLKHRSEEHTSELQSHLNLVCRLLLEKKKKTQYE